MKELICLRNSEDGSIYGTIKVTKRKRQLLLHKHVSMAKRATLGIRGLITDSRNTTKDERESNLNLLQIHTTCNINVEEILQMSNKSNNCKVKQNKTNLRRLFLPSLVFSETIYVTFIGLILLGQRGSLHCVNVECIPSEYCFTLF